MILLIATPQPVHATSGCGTHTTCYVGAYFTNTEATATKGFFVTDFSSTDVSEFGSGYSLTSVMSIAGQYTGGSCPCAYQNPFAIYNSGSSGGSVYWDPQIWNINGVVAIATATLVGSNSTFLYAGLIKYYSSGNTIKFVAFVYLDQQQFQKNTPYIYSWTYSTGDTNFYYGTATSNGYVLKEFQVGAESNYDLANNNPKWQVDQGSMEVYTSSWIYAAADSVEGNAAYQLPTSGVPVPIGGAVFTGANLSPYASTDAPSWTWTGTTIGTGTSLWTSTGGSTPYPCQVSGRC